MGTTSQTTAVRAPILPGRRPTSFTGMRALRFITLALLVFALQGPASADSATEVEWFKAVTAKESARLHQLPAFQRAGCDINALMGPVIARSREPLLKAGDRILAINSQPAQGSPDTPFQLLNALSTGDIAHLKIERKGTMLTVNIPCKNAAVEIGARLAALDAAAQGALRRMFGRRRRLCNAVRSEQRHVWPVETL
jgi:hypothetical protein